MKKILAFAIMTMLIIPAFSSLLPKVRAFSYPYILDVGISYEEYSVPITPPITQTPGGHMRLWYHLYNPNSYTVDVILGASIEIGGSHYSDPDHDKTVTLGPGDSLSWPNRYFYVPSGVPTGSYSVIYAIWATDWSVQYDSVSKSGWVNMVSSVSVQLSSSPSNVGTITWDCVTYNLPTTVYTTTRIHWSGGDCIHCTPPAGYEFDHWEASGHVDPWDEYSQWTNVDVDGSGSLEAVFTQFRFDVSASPPSRTITVGDSTTYTVSVTLTSGTAQSVSLSCSGCPSDAYCTFSPSSGNPDFASTLTVSTSASTPENTYTLTITGTGGAWSDSCTVQLVVNAYVNDLGVLPKLQHKDTMMLCLEGCSLTGDHAWDAEHQSRGCLHDNWYCVRACISMINSYFGGHLSQDRISFYVIHERNHNTVPENDLGHGRGLYPDETRDALSWALNGATIDHQSGKPTFAQIKSWIDSGSPILRRNGSGDWHATVIDGYEDAGQKVHVIDPWTGTETSVDYSTLNIYEVWIPPPSATARSDESSLSSDTDGDGVIDFDEINRFGTDPNSPDTDGDMVHDKQEIISYTFLSDGSFDASDSRKPDSDGDGLRCELDIDSDNGGVPDGLEDLNRNGRVDSGETDPLNPSDDLYLVHQESTENNSASSNLGSMEVDGLTRSLPYDSNRSVGTHGVRYNNVFGYRFDHWETTDGVSVTATTDNPTTFNVSGYGTLRAVYRAYECDKIWIEPYLTDGLIKGDSFTVDVFINVSSPTVPGGGIGLKAFLYYFCWDPSVINVTSYTMHIPPGWVGTLYADDWSVQGQHTYAYLRDIAGPFFTGVLSLCTYEFKVLWAPEEPQPDYIGLLDIYDGVLWDDTTTPIDHTTVNGSYRILSKGTIHDVAITGMTLLKIVVGQGYNASINVTVENHGDYTETFKITLYADMNTTVIGDEIVIGNQTVPSLANGTSTTLIFTWNTTGVPYGNYTVSAYAWPVPDETDTGDNSYVNGTVRVNMPGDVAQEYGLVDIVDVVYVAIHFGSEQGKPPPPNTQPYEPNADINDDGIIDIVDIVIVAIHFGESI